MPGDPEGPTDLNSDRPRPVTLFMGEVTRRRHPVLLALVFAFALFLAAAPLLFRYERSLYSEALSLYDRVCAAVLSDDLREVLSTLSARSGPHDALRVAFLATRLRCVDRRACRATFDPLPGSQSPRVYVLTLYPKDGAPPIRFRVVEEDGGLRWWPDAVSSRR